MKNKCTKFHNYRLYTAKSLGTWKMFDNPTDNHTDIEVPLYYELRFTKLIKYHLPLFGVDINLYGYQNYLFPALEQLQVFLGFFYHNTTFLK